MQGKEGREVKEEQSKGHNETGCTQKSDTQKNRAPWARVARIVPFRKIDDEVLPSSRIGTPSRVRMVDSLRCDPAQKPG